MIYLAVLLVLTGLLIVLVALFTESGRIQTAVVKSAPGTGSSAGMSRPGFDPDDIDIITPEERRGTLHGEDEEEIFISFDDEPPAGFSDSRIDSFHDRGFQGAEPDDFIPNSGPLAEMDDFVSSAGVTDEPDKRPLYAAGAEGRSAVYAVLFDDRSNAVDYKSGGAVADPSSPAYKNIKRIGRGEVQIDDDGLNFYMGEKFFRFDFHRIHDVWSGTGFFALPLKGGNAVKLFVLEGDRGFPGKVENYFQEYIKGS